MNDQDFQDRIAEAMTTCTDDLPQIMTLTLLATLTEDQVHRWIAHCPVDADFVNYNYVTPELIQRYVTPFMTDMSIVEATISDAIGDESFPRSRRRKRPDFMDHARDILTANFGTMVASTVHQDCTSIRDGFNSAVHDCFYKQDAAKIEDFDRLTSHLLNGWVPAMEWHGL